MVGRGAHISEVLNVTKSHVTMSPLGGWDEGNTVRLRRKTVRLRRKTVRLRRKTVRWQTEMGQFWDKSK